MWSISQWLPAKVKPAERRWKSKTARLPSSACRWMGLPAMPLTSRSTTTGFPGRYTPSSRMISQPGEAQAMAVWMSTGDSRVAAPPGVPSGEA